MDGIGIAEKSAATDSAEVRHFIGFAVGREWCGIDLLRVKEVIRVRDVTWLPKSPAFVRGIINLRGDVIPLIDLREKFEMPRSDHTVQSRVIVVERDGRMTGMIVDSASQVVRIPADQIEPPPPIISGLTREYVSAVGKVEKGLIVILNVDAILAVEEREAAEAAR